MKAIVLPWLIVASSWACAQAPQHQHRIVPGDTLIGLQQRLLRPDISWQQLQRHTGVRDPFRLQPGHTLTWPREWLAEQPAEAVVLFALGGVELERGGQRNPLSSGARLVEGDWLHAGPQGSATLRFADGARLVLRPSSRLQLGRLSQGRLGVRSQLQLQEGAADSRVPPRSAEKQAARRLPARFELLTPVANLGVRGTAFRTQVRNGQLHLEVLEGEVSAAQGRSAQAVPAGQGLLSQGQPGRPQALLPAPALALPARIERLPLRWTGAAPGASALRVQVLDAAGEQLWLDARAPASGWEGGAELPDGRYTLRVRAIAADGLEGLDAEAPFELAARPEPPFLQVPAAAAQQYAPRVEFRWTRSAAAHRYHLQIADDAGFTRLRHADATLQDTQFGLELPEGVHHWRVASVRADGHQGPWSDAQQLERLPPPPAPPPPQSERLGDRLQLRWAASPLAGVRYQLQAAATADFAQPWLDTTVNQAQAELQPPGGGTHHLRLRSLSPDGTPGPWGSTQSIEWPGGWRGWLFWLPALAWLL